MPSIYGAMNTAKMGLLTHQIGLEVTGQNIANVNNPEFTRQKLQLQAATPVSYGASPGMIGTGVRPVTVTRQQDRFLESQRVLNESQTKYWDQRQNFLTRLEVVFNEATGNGINSLYDSFFQGWQQLSFNPQGLTERTDVTAQGQNLSTMFGKLNGDMKRLRLDLDTQVKENVNEVNRITTEIAKLNGVIHEAEAENVHANDFRDRREALVRELAGYVDITTVEDSNKQVMVNLSTGRPLVLGQTAFQLSTQVRSDDAAARDIYWKDTNNTLTSITNEMKGGAVGSWITLRDTDLPSAIDKLDLLAATFIRDVNAQHSLGFGLDGSTGQDFFTGLNPQATANSSNTGLATVAAAINAPDKTNLHKFEVTFTGGATYNIQDLTMGTTVVTGQAYVSGANDAYFLTQGMNVAITNGGTGPATGDKFIINAANNAARNIAVQSNIVADSRKVAAGATTDNGNGQNALNMARLQSSNALNKTTPGSAGTATFAEYYNALVGKVGVDTKAAVSTYNQQEAIVFELNNRHEQIAGVSLDEEMVDLIKFQHAYQASARLVSVIDELLQTLVALGR